MCLDRAGEQKMTCLSLSKSWIDPGGEHFIIKAIKVSCVGEMAAMCGTLCLLLYGKYKTKRILCEDSSYTWGSLGHTQTLLLTACLICVL